MPADRAPVAFSLALAAALAGSGCSCGAEPIAQVVVKLRAVPGALDFGAVPVGAVAHRTVAVANTGNGPYAPAPADVPAIAGDAFRVETACTLPLAPRGFCNVDIVFAPESEGDLSGAYTIHAPDGDIIVALTGHGDPAAILVDPPALDFGSVDVGTSVNRSITVTNQGGSEVDASLVITGNGFFTGGSARADLVVAAGASVEVPVAFSPSQGGAFTGRAVLEICGAGCGPEVALSAVATAPRIDVEPRTADFGAVAVGDQGTVDLVVSNDGAGNLVVSALDLVVPTSDVTLSAPALPFVVPEGGSTTVTLSFSPRTARGDLGGTLRLHSTDPVSPDVLIPVDGSAPGAAIAILPTAVNLGVLDPGDTRSVDVVLRSVGTVAADVSAVSLSGSSFSFVGPTPPAGTLAPGEALLFTVQATASASDATAGGASGHVTATAAGAPDATLALQFLSGTSGCQPRAPEPNVALGSVVVGQGSSGSIVVENVGTAACTFSRALPAPGFPFDAGFSFSTATLGTLAPGASANVDFAYSAAEQGQRSAFLQVTFTEAAAPLLLSATARGVTGTLVGEPPLIAIGPLTQGCSDTSRTATFVNKGSSSVTVTSIALDNPASPFSIQVPALPAVVHAGAALSVPLASLPVAPGSYAAVINATTDVLEATVRLTLDVTEPGTPVSETFTAADISQVDVLFVVDNSGSMEDDQQILAQNFGTFIGTAFTNTSLDFHIGVTTTGVLDGSGGPFVGPFLRRSDNNVAGLFADQAAVGTNGSGIELGLEGMRRALDDFRNTTNAGFLRDSAGLSVIVVSDEEDNGGDQAAADIDPTVARPAESYIEFLRGLKGGQLSNAPILFSEVVTPGQSQRYTTVSNAFGGLALDIGDPNWGTQLSGIGAATFGLQRLFRLAGVPDPASVTVTVNGTALPANKFTVNGEDVVLTDDPPAHAVVVVTYTTGCGP